MTTRQRLRKASLYVADGCMVAIVMLTISLFMLCLGSMLMPPPAHRVVYIVVDKIGGVLVVALIGGGLASVVAGYILGDKIEDR